VAELFQSQEHFKKFDHLRLLDIYGVDLYCIQIQRSAFLCPAWLSNPDHSLSLNLSN
jgi:hypothetical protein